MLYSDVVVAGYRSKLSFWLWINGRQEDIRSNPDPRYYRYAYLVVEPSRTYRSFYGSAIYKRRFICSYDLNDQFSCRVFYQRLGRGCYKIHNKTVSWFDARSICLNETSDLATFEDGNFSLTFEIRNVAEYWIGLRKEIWRWTSGQDIMSSNWENFSPHYENGDCLCLRATTGKWKECDCSLKYRYICNQDYANEVGVSSSRFHPTPNHALDHNLWNKTSAGQVYPIESQTFPGVAVAFGVVSSCLVIIIIVVVVVAVIKVRRSRSGGGPNAVHAVDVPSTSAPVRSALEKVPDVHQYEELDLPAIGETSNEFPYEELDLPAIGETSNEIPYEELDLPAIGETSNETPYEELDLAP